MLNKPASVSFLAICLSLILGTSDIPAVMHGAVVFGFLLLKLLKPHDTKDLVGLKEKKVWTFSAIISSSKFWPLTLLLGLLFSQVVG